MRKRTKLWVSGAIALLLVAAFFAIVYQAAGGKLDVIGEGSIASFETILQSMQARIRADEAGDGWYLEAPDGAARFYFSAAYGKSPRYDVMLEWDAQPFLDAGLDAGKLPERYVQSDGKLAVGRRLGEGGAASGEPSPLSAYARIAREHPGTINYHAAMDHFGVKLGDGMFEWANDIEKSTINGEIQDKDIVFVIDPEPLIEAGVDPERVAGWAYAEVEVEEHGRMFSAYKLLKPFNLD